jgi:hypothetical protein
VKTVVATSLLIAALLAAPAFGAGPDFAGMQVQPYDPPKAAPALALPSLDGKMVSGGSEGQGGDARLLGHLVTRLPGGVAFRQQSLRRVQG